MDLPHKTELLEQCMAHMNDGTLPAAADAALRDWWHAERARDRQLVASLVDHADLWELFIVEHPAHRHRFYAQLSDDVTIEEYAAFLLENRGFPSFLPLVAKTLAAQQTEVARAAIQRNIDDEQVPVPHADLMRRLFMAVKSAAGDRVKVTTFDSLIDRTLIFYYGFYCDPWNLVGSLWATEVMAQHRMTCMGQGLTRLGISGDDVEYIRIHLACDDEHAAEWRTDVVEPSLALPDGALFRRPIVEGVVACLQTSARYLDDLSLRIAAAHA